MKISNLLYFTNRENRSLLQYFKKSERTQPLDPSKVCESMKNNLPDNVTAKDLEKVQQSLKITCEGKKKRVVYGEKDKQENSNKSFLT